MPPSPKTSAPPLEKVTIRLHLKKDTDGISMFEKLSSRENLKYVEQQVFPLLDVDCWCFDRDA